MAVRAVFPGTSNPDSARDYIDENKWNMETGLSSTVYDVLRFRWRKPDDYQGTLEELRTRRHELLGDRTQVTYEEDVAGAEKVWHWVQPRLQRLGFLSTKS